MGVTEVPSGNAPMEQPKDSKTTNNGNKGLEENTSKQMTSKRTFTICAVGLILLVVAAVLIAVLPDWGKDDNTKAKTTDEAKKAEHKPQFLVQTSGVNGTILDVELRLFSDEGSTEMYNDQEELKNDLGELAKFFLNDAMANANAMRQPVTGGGQEFDVPEMEMEDGSFAGDAGATGAPPDETQSDGTQAVGEDVTDFDTNSQELTIEQADFVKSDGELIFAAYSDYLVVWAKDGSGIITQIQMDALDNDWTPDYGNPEPFPFPEESEPRPEVDFEEEPEMLARSSFWYNPKPYIQALLIHDNRLTVVVTGYGMENARKLDRSPTLSGYLATRVLVYDINSGDLRLDSQTDLNGEFREAFSIDEYAYIVTHSSMNTWDHLVSPIQRWQPTFEGLSDNEYTSLVQTMVGDGLVDDFVTKLLEELEVKGPVDLARLSLFTESISNDGRDSELYGSVAATSITQVASFDMTVPLSIDVSKVDNVQPHLAASFHPGTYGHVYGTGGMILLGDQGWSWLEEEGRSAAKTYLVGFTLNGATSAHSVTGSVDGSMLSPYSLDYVTKAEGSYVRVATTQMFWSPWVDIWIDEGLTMQDETPDEEPMDEVADSEAVLESSTLNQIVVLKVPTSGTGALEDVGSVELGEPNEVFTAVRFFDDFAYAVTYEQTDPFYVVDLSQEQPRTAGELKVSGFSEYLHPIDSDNQFLVAVGQDADEKTGDILGMQISLFDASNPSEPTLINRLVIEDDRDAWSSTSASWDPRAFRFLKLGEKTGKLIIPLNIYRYIDFDQETGEKLEFPEQENFEGFRVFDISNDVITTDFDVDHSFEIRYDENCNYMYDWLPERSFVFDGNVMTMRKYTVISTSLTTGETIWTTRINESFLGCEKSN